MYKFRRRIYVGKQSQEFWFGLTSKSRDRHSNFTLFLLTENPNSTFSYAEQIKSGFHSKADAERFAIRYAKDLLWNLIQREKEIEQQKNEKLYNNTFKEDQHE